MKISAVILTKNEEKNIKECLGSLKWTDEIIVIDDNSEDKTVEIARKMGAKIYSRVLSDDFSKQRNFGVEQATGDWILFIDADERISQGLAYEISNTLRFSDSNKHNGYYLKRLDSMFGKELKYGEVGNINLLRLAKKDSGKWEGKVHEEWKIEGEVGYLKNTILHYPHKTIREFLEEINFYTDLKAKELYAQGKHVHPASIIFYPLFKFFVNYFLKRGFKDGIEGLILAVLMSLHSFLVRAKQWLLWQKK